MKKRFLPLIIIIFTTAGFLAGAKWQANRRAIHDETRSKDLYGWSDSEIATLKLKLREYGVTPEQMATFGHDVQLLVAHHEGQTEYDQILTGTFALAVYQNAKKNDLKRVKALCLSRLKSFVENKPAPIVDSENRTRLLRKIEELAVDSPELAEILKEK